MIKSINGLAFRFFRANKFLALSSIASIMLSVFLIITMAVFSSNAKQSLEDEMKKLYGNMDLSVGYNMEQNKIIDKVLFRKLTSSDAVQESSGVIINRLTLNQLGADIYTIGAENDALVKSRYHFTRDITDQDIILNASLAEAMGLTVGDTVQIDNKSYTLIEILDDLDASGTTIDIILLAREQVKRVIYEKTGVENEATYILIKAKEKSQIPLLVNELREIDKELRIDLAEEDEYYIANLQSLTIFMIVMSVLVLIVSSLFVVSNSEAFMYKYRNQMAIMRSLGATRGQVFKVVWIQFSLLNLIGSGLGFILAFISNRISQSWVASLFTYESGNAHFQYGTAFFAMIGSIAVIQLFMLIPSYRGSKILPLKIIEGNENNDFSGKRLGKRLGFALLISSVFTLLTAFVKTASGSEAGYFLLTAFLLTLGIFRLFPVYLPSLLTKIAPILKKLLGNLSYVSIRNVIPQVRKNTFVVLTISLMIMITVMGSAMFKTIQSNEEQYLKVQFPTNIVIKSRLGHDSTINDKDLMKSVTELTGIEKISSLSTASSAYMKRVEDSVSFSYRLVDLKEMEEQGLLQLQSLDNLSDSIVISRAMADRYQISIGDPIELEVYSEDEQANVSAGTVVVKAITDHMLGSYYDALMDWSYTGIVSKSNVFEKAFISSSDQKQTLTQLEELKRLYPGQLQVSSYEQSVEQSDERYLQRWSIYIAVLIIILISVMMGVCNLLIHNIHSKRREFAVLRTISVTETGILKVILTQVILYLTIGIVLGLGLGMLSTFTIGLIDGGITRFDFKLVTMASFIMMGIACAVIIPFANKIRKSRLTSELTMIINKLFNLAPLIQRYGFHSLPLA